MEEPKMKHWPTSNFQKHEQIEINFLKICSTECYCLVKHVGNFWVGQNEAGFVRLRRNNPR